MIPNQRGPMLTKNQGIKGTTPSGSKASYEWGL